MDVAAFDDLTQGTATRNDSGGQSRPLESFRVDSGSRPVVVTLDLTDEPVVVLGTNLYGTVEVLPTDGPVLTLSGNTSATPVTDPGQQAECFGRAIAELVAENRSQNSQLDRARAEHGAAQQHISAVLAEIRDHAVRWHSAGDIRQNDLDNFLRTLQLAAFEPRVRITYRITGGYNVSAGISAAFLDAEKFLAADLSRVGHVVPGSHSPATVEPTGAYAVDALARTGEAVGQPETRVAYVITGSYEVDTADAARATRDAELYLGVNLDGIDGVVDGPTKVEIHVDAAVMAGSPPA